MRTKFEDISDEDKAEVDRLCRDLTDRLMAGRITEEQLYEEMAHHIGDMLIKYAIIEMLED